MSNNKQQTEITREEIETANQKSVEIYYQQAIATFNFLSKRNDNIRNKAGILLTFLCGAIGFCIKCFIDIQASYSYIFLMTAFCYYIISIFCLF